MGFPVARDASGIGLESTWEPSQERHTSGPETLRLDKSMTTKLGEFLDLMVGTADVAKHTTNPYDEV